MDPKLVYIKTFLLLSSNISHPKKNVLPRSERAYDTLDLVNYNIF